MVQEGHLEVQGQVLHQEHLLAQEAQQVQVHLEVQDYLAIDIEHLLQLHLH
jgi:hypothetical protein